MELPRAYLEETLTQLEPLTKPAGTIGIRQVQSTLGKAARIGYLVPDASPFIASLWAAFRRGREQALEGKEGTNPHRLPVRRFATAAKWFSTMLREALNNPEPDGSILRRVMSKSRQLQVTPEVPVITFDASPWGGGGILWIGNVAREFTHFLWKPSTLKTLGARIGDCKGQTPFEYMTLLMVCITFSSTLATTGAVVKGDNLSSLNEALKVKSTIVTMNSISRELTWRKVALRWRYCLQHLPAELNDEADALSRLAAEPRRELPVQALRRAKFAHLPRQTASFWRARISYD